eukprot:CAMPEP_0173216878 /NCGR_PEP_ID=MMETSP1142-20121109/168_1 /TAXON_ID=483371 /ORGANISM="non described non described, Strain CCMP2298" /LENGTH=206 /DNA_ID=CAMNT_0014144363 /DNA_START=442 /DNA_END=1058 /DNA_ORIENTATION=+
MGEDNAWSTVPLSGLHATAHPVVLHVEDRRPGVVEALLGEGGEGQHLDCADAHSEQGRSGAGDGSLVQQILIHQHVRYVDLHAQVLPCVVQTQRGGQLTLGAEPNSLDAFAFIEGNQVLDFGRNDPSIDQSHHQPLTMADDLSHTAVQRVSLHEPIDRDVPSHREARACFSCIANLLREPHRRRLGTGATHRPTDDQIVHTLQRKA